MERHVVAKVGELPPGTGALLWQGVDERAGTKAWGRDPFNSWDNVDNACKAWATQFAKRLGGLGACPQ